LRLQFSSRVGRRRARASTRPWQLARLHEVVGAGFERTAKAPIRRRGDRAGSRLGLAARDQRKSDLVRRQRTEVEARAARTDRRQKRVRACGYEDEYRHRGRFFERLQQRVLRRRHERVGLVDDDDAAPALEGAIRGTIDDLTDLFDLDRAGVAGLENENVGMDAAGNAGAAAHVPAGIDIRG
jgi:hypothetical protein